MGIIDWTNKFSVGNESLDTDHKILMDLINQLHDAYAGNRELETLEIVFDVLMDYIDRHFVREETMMAEHGYPSIVAHHESHERLKRDVMALHHRYLAQRNPEFIVELLAFLTDWWSSHILEEDMDYKPFLIRKSDDQAAA